MQSRSSTASHLPEKLLEWLRDSGHGAVNSEQSVSGGCINETSVLKTENGDSFFLKRCPNPPAGFFEAEAEGLEALRQRQALRVPRVHLVDSEFLLLEDLGSAPRPPSFSTELGEGLAVLHAEIQPGFGFSRDNFCGTTAQHNPPCQNGFEFFRRRRLVALAELARDRGQLSNSEFDRIGGIADRLKQWIPPQPPVLIHGDLWSGNVHCDGDGAPALIDPACYWGWAEAELAMTSLFGGFDRRFYASYEAAAGIDGSWRERAPLYNLYHLLNHLLLFGGGYHGQVMAVVRRFGG